MDEVRVLLVDDEPQVRSLIRKILSKQNFQIFEARDEEIALRVIESLGGAVDLVLCDDPESRPEDENLVSALKKRFPLVPILVVSTEFVPCDLPLYDAFIAKPFRPSELLATVERLVTKSHYQHG
ncbi:MAG TPA: response regulator [Bryobacteraceae bacterium]|nr:response regulator [Bryobacteraceae bacterium]